MDSEAETSAVADPPPLEEPEVVLSHEKPRTLEERASMHAAELRRAVQDACGTSKIRTRFDASRDIWQAWAGTRATKLRGEGRTEMGALRRLRNAKGKLLEQERRPIPGGGSTQLIDAIAKRQHVESTRTKSYGWVKWVAIVIVAVLIQAASFYAWIVREEERRQAPPRPIAVFPPERETEAEIEPTVRTVVHETDAGVPQQHVRSRSSRSREEDRP